MCSAKILILSVLFTAVSANQVRSKRQLFNTDSGNVGGVHETTNNVGPFVGLSDAIKAVPVGKSPLVSVGDVNVGSGKSRQKRQLFNTDSGNVGGVHNTTNNVGPLVGLSDAIKAVPLGKGPLVSVGNVNARQKRGIFCFLGIGCDKQIFNNDSGHVGGSYSTVNTV
ncbi:unnamed protein product [Orchesella dallaii]|uniref:Uncharacterized protein n=1 Tax=Orchesella dallaii TaxID=48710 RepID=A0ABP1PPT6_9HEXA